MPPVRLAILLLALAVFMAAPGPRGLALCFCPTVGCDPVVTTAPGGGAPCCCTGHDDLPLRLIGDGRECDGQDTALFAGEAAAVAGPGARPLSVTVALPTTMWSAVVAPDGGARRLRPARAPPPRDLLREHLASIRLLI